MKATINITEIEIKEIEIPVTTVTLERDIDPNKVHLFYCNDCGQSLFQYKGRIAFITPGAAPCNMPIIIRCNVCKKKYMIRTNI
jgi:hypothetical protein